MPVLALSSSSTKKSSTWIGIMIQLSVISFRLPTCSGYNYSSKQSQKVMKHILKNELTFTYLNVKETHLKKFSIYKALDTFSWQSREFQDIKKPSGICLFVMFWRILGCRMFIKEMKMACIFHYCLRQWVFTASLSQE